MVSFGIGSVQTLSFITRELLSLLSPPLLLLLLPLPPLLLLLLLLPSPLIYSTSNCCYEICTTLEDQIGLRNGLDIVEKKKNKPLSGFEPRVANLKSVSLVTDPSRKTIDDFLVTVRLKLHLHLLTNYEY
jgi:hypothetical protein